MGDVPILETERLILRGMQANDFEAHAALWADPEVTRFIGGKPLSREEAWGSFTRYFGMWALMGFGFWVVTDRLSGERIGAVGFQERMRDMNPSIEGTLEAGWTIAPRFGGQGLANEAIASMLAWADRNLPTKRITAIIAPQNMPSLRVAQRQGFQEFALTQYQGNEVLLLERPRSAS